jgi:hypothetical protein
MRKNGGRLKMVWLRRLWNELLGSKILDYSRILTNSVYAVYRQLLSGGEISHFLLKY